MKTHPISHIHTAGSLVGPQPCVFTREFEKGNPKGSKAAAGNKMLGFVDCGGVGVKLDTGERGGAQVNRFPRLLLLGTQVQAKYGYQVIRFTSMM